MKTQAFFELRELNFLVGHIETVYKSMQFLD